MTLDPERFQAVLPRNGEADRRCSAPVRAVRPDINYLFYRQQVERSLGGSAATAEARKSHRDLAALCERTITRVAGGQLRFLRERESG